MRLNICANAVSMSPDPIPPVCIYTADGERTASGENLLRAARLWAAREGLGNVDLTLARPLYQKPFFPHSPEIRFSVTHSGGCWACAFSRQPVGLDLQITQPVQGEKLARRFFHPREAEYLAAHPEEFFRVWTAKESYVKLTGRGIDDAFHHFSVVCPGGLRSQLDGAFIRHIPFRPGYTLCLCAPSIGEVTVESMAQK